MIPLMQIQMNYRVALRTRMTKEPEKKRRNHAYKPRPLDMALATILYCPCYIAIAI